MPTNNEWFLGSVALSFITGSIGSFLGGKNKITEQSFEEHKKSCARQQQLKEDIYNLQVKNIYRKIDEMSLKLDKLIDHKESN